MEPTDFEILTLLASGSQTLQELVGPRVDMQIRLWYSLIRMERQGLVRCENVCVWYAVQRWELVHAAD